MKIKFWLLFTSSLILFLSCDKEDKNNPQGPTKTELLTTGSWKRTALTSSPAYDWYGNGNFATDILSVMLDCEKDNLDTYKTNGIWELNEGSSKCDPLDPQTWAVSWAFEDNETKLIFDGTDEYTLLELTATTLKFESTFTEQGVTYTHIETYGH